MELRDLLKDAAEAPPDVPAGGLDWALRRGAQLRRHRLMVMAGVPIALVAVVAVLVASLGSTGGLSQRVHTVPANRPPIPSPANNAQQSPTASQPAGSGLSSSGASANAGVNRSGGVATRASDPVAAGATGGTWTSAGSMAGPRFAHTATLLPSGEVLVAGGSDQSQGVPPTVKSDATAELYDPSTGRWRSTGSMSVPRTYFTATLLRNGKVLVTGGESASGGSLPGATATAELYDPSTGSWSITGSMAFPRSFHTATLLPNGKVLVAGGATPGPAFGGVVQGEATATAELYDPATGSWSSTGSMATARFDQDATLLPSGKVLVVGGQTGSGTTGSAELYDPATGRWRSAHSMATPRGTFTATLLPNGEVLVAGGSTGSGYTGSAELYDPAADSWSFTGSLATSRENLTATLLLGGKVLVAGGDAGSGGGYTGTAELYDPSTGSWSSTASMAMPRDWATATLLRSGKVLVAGGGTVSGSTASAELYTAPE
jgi:Kelch motif protein/galactose oxidase-like protein